MKVLFNINILNDFYILIILNYKMNYLLKKKKNNEC